MKKLESNFMNMAVALTVICLLAAVLLSSFFNLTEEPILKSNEEKQQSAIFEVLPFENMELTTERVAVGDDSLNVHNASVNGEFVGVAVESFSNQGFNGQIKVMVGFDADGNVLNYSVLEQKETPGLGTKMVDWFKPSKKTTVSLVERLFGFQVGAVEKQSSIVGQNMENQSLFVKKDGGTIDAITAATISSRAFLDAVNRAYKVYSKNGDTDGFSGASAVWSDENGDSETSSSDEALNNTVKEQIEGAVDSANQNQGGGYE